MAFINLATSVLRLASLDLVATGASKASKAALALYGHLSYPRQRSVRSGRLEQLRLALSRQVATLMRPARRRLLQSEASIQIGNRLFDSKTLEAKRKQAECLSGLRLAPDFVRLSVRIVL